MPNFNEIRTANWVLRLPEDWSSLSDQVQGFHFESRDGTKGLYIATHVVAPEHPGSVEELARWFVAAEISTLQDMRDFAFDIADRRMQVAPDACVALLDTVAPAQHYRVMAKILARPGQVVRASFHDYQCQRYVDSCAYFAAILDSLAFVDSQAPAPGVLLH
jgi:hypothetical protein